MHSVVTSAMPSLPSCVFLAYASLVGLVGPTLADEVKNIILICISSEQIIFYDTIHFICIMSYIAHDSSRPPSTQSQRWPHKSPVPSSWNWHSINIRCTFSTHIKACDYMREFTCYLLSTANRIKGQVHKSIVFERSLGHQTWDLYTGYYA